MDSTGCAWRQGTAPMNPMLLQHTLRGLCSNESQWVYAVFWRILPRNYPPPQWDTEGGIMDRSKGNKRNWILVWEDGFCNFSACSSSSSSSTRVDSCGSSNSFLSVRQQQQQQQQQDEPEPGELTMNPELFFKMSHEVYNYGEGLMGKVAVDNSHKWVCREPLENEIGFNSPWQNSIDPHPRTWEGQFKSGIQTIAVVAVQEGVLQLGSTQKITEDLNFVLHMQRNFSFLHSIPNGLAPHPTSAEVSRKRDNSMPFSRGSIDQFLALRPVTGMKRPPESSSIRSTSGPLEFHNSNMNSHGYGYRPECPSPPKALHTGLHSSPNMTTAALMPSMSSLQALLSKLPSVTVPIDNSNNGSGSYGRAFGVPVSHGSDLQRIVEGEAMVATTAGVQNFRPVAAKEKPCLNNNNNNNSNSMFDSLDNFTEFGIQEALENGDSSYTSFLNEICS